MPQNRSNGNGQFALQSCEVLIRERLLDLWIARPIAARVNNVNTMSSENLVVDQLIIPGLEQFFSEELIKKSPPLVEMSVIVVIRPRMQRAA